MTDDARARWRLVADRALTAADDCMSADDPDGAAIEFLRAALLYRLAGLGRASEDDPAGCRADRAGHISAFRAAVPLLPVDTRVIEFEREDISVRGYHFRAAHSRTFLLHAARDDSTAEMAALELVGPTQARGWHCLVFQAENIQPGRSASGLDARELSKVIGWLVGEVDLAS